MRASGYAARGRRPSNTHVRPVTGLALAHLRDLLARHASNQARGSARAIPGRAGPRRPHAGVSARTTCCKSNVLLHDHRRVPGPGGRRPETAGKDVAKPALLTIGPGPWPAWTAPAARRLAPGSRSPGAGYPQVPAPRGPGDARQGRLQTESPLGPRFGQAAHHRPAETIPGIGQPVPQSGHRSPPEADPWPARAPAGSCGQRQLQITGHRRVSGTGTPPSEPPARARSR